MSCMDMYAYTPNLLMRLCEIFHSLPEAGIFAFELKQKQKQVAVA